MKIVVFGPDKRTGALRDRNLVDLSYACAKHLHEGGGASPVRSKWPKRWCRQTSRG